jgi:hypothetical protein
MNPDFGNRGVGRRWIVRSERDVNNGAEGA